MIYPGPSRRARGFTLVELMVVVAIVGVLSAVAVPVYLRYLRRSQTVEATMNLTQIYDGVMTYWAAEHTNASGTVLHRLFPSSVGYTPTTGCCSYADRRCPPDPNAWTSGSWTATHFIIQEYHRYRYAMSIVAGSGAAAGDALEVYAQGDLNCDGVYSLFVRRATVDPSMQITTAGTTAFGELQ